MVAFPNCKINLGLRVTGKRADGFHDIETVFYPLPLRDALEIVRSNLLELHVTGIDVPGEPSANLALKAYELIKADHPGLPAVKIFLHKAIPIGGGLGGGSSDGAFTLMLLNKKFGLNIPDDRMRGYALQLGSDAPFFVLNKPCVATGRGELMNEVNISLEGYRFALVDSGVHVNTGWAFGKVTSRPQKPGMPANQTGAAAASTTIANIISLPPETWREQLVNEFEGPVFEEYPVLGSIKDELYKAGAVYASMTGTGGCVYGIFNGKTKTLPLEKDFKVYHLNKNH